MPSCLRNIATACLFFSAHLRSPTLLHINMSKDGQHVSTSSHFTKMKLKYSGAVIFGHLEPESAATGINSEIGSILTPSPIIRLTWCFLVCVFHLILVALHTTTHKHCLPGSHLLVYPSLLLLCHWRSAFFLVSVAMLEMLVVFFFPITLTDVKEAGGAVRYDDVLMIQ